MWPNKTGPTGDSNIFSFIFVLELKRILQISFILSIFCFLLP
jgi:hypothetical protein